jgi:hypothetical protein
MRFAAIDHRGEPRATRPITIRRLGSRTVAHRARCHEDQMRRFSHLRSGFFHRFGAEQTSAAIQQPIVEATEDLEPVSERGSIALRPASTCDQLINSSPEGSYRMDTAKAVQPMHRIAKFRFTQNVVRAK